MKINISRIWKKAQSSRSLTNEKLSENPISTLALTDEDLATVDGACLGGLVALVALVAMALAMAAMKASVVMASAVASAAMAAMKASVVMASAVAMASVVVATNYHLTLITHHLLIVRF